MTWVLAGVAAWLALAVLIGVVVGRGIRLADRKESESCAETVEPNFVVDPSAQPAPEAPLPGAPRPRVPSSEEHPSPRHHDLA
jgi:hypothetical protein